MQACVKTNLECAVQHHARLHYLCYAFDNNGVKYIITVRVHDQHH